MKRKVAAILLASLMAFGLAACGNQETTPEAPAAENTEESTEESTEAEESGGGKDGSQDRMV